MDGDFAQNDRSKSHNQTFLDISHKLNDKVRKFKLIKLDENDIFRDKSISKILQVFEEFE